MPFPVSSGLLDACVLAVLSRDDAYGYRLTQELNRAVDLSDSTLYPVLRRLQKENLLTTYERAYDGRNRRYYRITREGLKKHAEYTAAWKVFKQNIDKIIFGEDLHEQSGLH